MSFPTKPQDAKIVSFSSISPLPLSVFLLTLTCVCSLYSEKFSISPRLSYSLCTSECVCMCASVCLVWCVLQFGTLKQSKIPAGRTNPGAECRWRDQWDILVLTDLPLSLCLSFFSFMFSLSLSLPPTLFFLSFFSVFASLSMSISQYIFICNPLSPIHHFLPQGERCSFSVQMWFYFLCGLRSDLWAVLPADSAKEMLGQVLSETLQLLVQRYTRARPSYRRHLQVRYSIMYHTGLDYIHLRNLVPLCNIN